MTNLSKINVDLMLRNTDALSGTPRILMRQAFALSNQGLNVSTISETIHDDLLKHQSIKAKKTFKWPKNGLFQRHFFDWQAQRMKRKNAITLGHGDTISQDILFLHTCVHKGAEVAPGKHNEKNYSIPFHKEILSNPKNYKEIVCVSHMMKKDIENRFQIKCPIHVIHPFYDSELFKQLNPEVTNNIRQELKVENGEIVLGVIASGNLENRGAYALLKACQYLTESEKKLIKIFIVGKESNSEKIYKLASEVGLKDRVLWKNPQKDVINLINATDIIIHAAKIEAAGISFLESLALARPVITTSTVGFAEILPDAQKDFIIEKQDPEEIAKKLKILIQDENLRKSLGEANQKVALPLTGERYDQKFLEIFQNHLEQYRS